MSDREKLAGILKKNRFDLCSMAVAISGYLLNNHIFKKQLTGAAAVFCRNHLNDLLCPFFFLGFAQFMLSLIDRQLTKVRHLMLLAAAGGFVWEVIGPIINPRSVGDPVDFLCYIVGGAVYAAVKVSGGRFF